MKNPESYTTSFTVEASPAQVFAAINRVRGWWSGEIEGVTDTLGATFTYRVPGVHSSTQKISQLDPAHRVVWEVTDAELAFVADKSEWKGTTIVFEITPDRAGSQVRFIHDGLAPSCDCYADCAGGWSALVNGNLRQWILTGTPQPSPW